MERRFIQSNCKNHLCKHSPPTFVHAISCARYFLNWYAGVASEEDKIIICILALNAQSQLEQNLTVLPATTFSGGTAISGMNVEKLTENLWKLADVERSSGAEDSDSIEKNKQWYETVWNNLEDVSGTESRTK